MVRLLVRIVGFIAKSILSDFRQELNLLNLSQPTVYKELPHLKVAVLESDPIDPAGKTSTLHAIRIGGDCRAFSRTNQERDCSAALFRHGNYDKDLFSRGRALHRGELQENTTGDSYIESVF